MTKPAATEFIEESPRQIPVYRRVQVAVVGGGPSGIGAALGAARNGAEVLLIERNPVPGGTGPMAFVNEFHSTENLTGLGAEIVRRLGEIGGAAADAEPEYSQISYDPEIFRFVLLQMLEEAGVQLLFYSWVVDAVVEGDTVKGVVIENKSGRQAVLAEVVIDCSGDADLAARVGVEMQPYVEPQPMVMQFRMGGIDYDRIEQFARESPEDFSKRRGIPPGSIDGSKIIHVTGWYGQMRRAKETGLLPAYFGNFISIYGITPEHRAHGIGTLYATRVLNRDPFDADDLTAAELEGRRQVRECLPFLKICPGLENAYVIDLAPNVGVRDSRRIVGDYTLVREDIFADRVFDDDIAVTVHRGPDVTGWRMHPPDGSEGSKEHTHTLYGMAISLITHGVPYRCLLPKGFERLLVAGKTISMDYETHARCRDQVECMGFGQGAGVAAAIAVRDAVTPRQVDVGKVRALLTAQGVNLDKAAINVAKIKAILRERGQDVVGA